MPLTVATLNVWNRMGPWEERCVAIREQLRSLDPDILALQEVVQIPGEHGFQQLDVIANGFPHHRFAGMHPDAVHPMGNAILSRWPIRRSEVLPLPQCDTDEHRTLVHAVLDSPFGPVPMFCTHLNWKLHEAHVRAIQMRFVVDQIRARVSPGEFPTILAGDFNAEPDSDEIRFLRGLCALGGSGAYFADAFALGGDGTPGHTFSRENPFAASLREPNRRIDYVFVQGPDDAGRGEPLRASRCFDRPVDGTYASDHFGVVATISTD